MSFNFDNKIQVEESMRSNTESYGFQKKNPFGGLQESNNVSFAFDRKLPFQGSMRSNTEPMQSPSKNQAILNTH